jgi:peptidoglycan/LPS O-acetylase OafA/YrhL
VNTHADTLHASSRIPSLDGFRAIAIILVVIEHTWRGALHPFDGKYGVFIFFVISGFLITTLLLKEKANTGTISLRQFYIRRFLRIFPVAYLYLFVLLILNITLSLHVPAASFLSAALYVQNTALFHAPPGYYVGHYWSLSVEEQFYLLFPFLLVRRSATVYAVITATLIFVIPLITYLYAKLGHDSFVPGLVVAVLQLMPAILVGSVISVLMFYDIIKLKLTGLMRSVMVVILLLAGGYLISNVATLGTIASLTLGYIFTAIAIVLCFTPGNDFMFRLLNSKVFTIIGIYSYSIYIWQEMFTEQRPWKGMFPGSDSDLLNLAVLVLVTYLSYNFYEKKFLLLKERFH